AKHIIGQLPGNNLISQASDAQDIKMAQLIASIPIARLRDEGILDVLLSIVDDGHHSQPSYTRDTIADMSLDELIHALGNKADTGNASTNGG
ncbi:hypothetical protein, partial [Mycobacterium paragordonae]